MTQTLTVVGGEIISGGDCGDCSAYASPALVNTIFGTTNVNKWADVENTNDSGLISGRLAWALCLATNTVESRLLNGPYAIPFDPPVPCIIQDCVARLAGVLLYDARRMVDDADAADLMRPHRKSVMETVKQIRARTLQLVGVDASKDYPAAANGSYYNNCGRGYEGLNPEAMIYLPFYWRPLVMYPPPCGGNYFGWWPGLY